MIQKPRGYRGKIWLALGLGVLALVCLSGCQYPNALEMDYGRSVRNNVAQQIINPNAGLEPSPAVGLVPEAGVNVIERYEKSFKEKVPPATIIQITGK